MSVPMRCRASAAVGRVQVMPPELSGNTSSYAMASMSVARRPSEVSGELAHPLALSEEVRRPKGAMASA